MSNEFKYQVRIFTSEAVVEQEGTKHKDVQLEDMVFATPIIEKQTLWVPLPDSYGKNDFDDNSSNRLLLGEVESIYPDAGFGNKKAATYLLVTRTTIDQRFDKFVEDYQSLVPNK